MYYCRRPTVIYIFVGREKKLTKILRYKRLYKIRQLFEIFILKVVLVLRDRVEAKGMT